MKRFEVRINSLLTIALVCSIIHVSGQNTELFSDSFNELGDQWETLELGNHSGNVSVSNSVLNITSQQDDQYAVFNSQHVIDGHFQVELVFTNDNHVGLALFKDNNGSPDPGNYTMLHVTTNDNEEVVVSVSDKQEGEPDVLDNTGAIDKGRYSHTLKGDTYSLPFTSTNKRLRILRHKAEGFFHFYYAVSKLIDGEVATDWIELAPSKEWGDLAQGYFVGLVAINGTATFDRVSVVQVPEMDISDVHTGFEAVWRYYNWSGFGGEALVVSFGDLFPFRNDDRKFIFWDQANYVPAWHFNNEMQFSYGFNETWGGGSVGCFEPMSDRLLRYAKVKLIEDNPVRKVIHWEYVLIDPDYKVPDNEKGTQLPEVDEYYMIYADGSIIRKIRYTPKLDTDFRNWHELTELIIIGGGNNRPGSLVDKPALSVSEIGRSNKQFHPLGQIDFENNYKMGATAMIAHLKNAPDAFNAFADDSYFPETYGGYQLNYKIDWHNINLNFSHWPINKEPYMEPHKSWSAWPEQISHTSLIGMGVYGGTDWDDHYMEDEEGRRYREWLSLEGLSEHRNYEQTADKVNSWLFRGNVTMTNDSATYLSYSLSDKWFEFNAEKWKPACYVQIDPYRALVNPVLKINNWSSGNVVVNVNKKTLESDEYIAYIDSGNSLYILLNGDYSDGLEAKISTSDILVSVSEKKTGTNTPKVSPNPVTSGSLNVDLEDNIPEAHITLYDLSGRAVFKTVVNDKSTIIGTKPYHTGTYLLEIRSGNEIYRKKVIILDH